MAEPAPPEDPEDPTEPEDPAEPEPPAEPEDPEPREEPEDPVRVELGEDAPGVSDDVADGPLSSGVSVLSLTGAISGVSSSPTWARSVRVSSAPPPDSMSMLVSSRPDLADAAETVLLDLLAFADFPGFPDFAPDFPAGLSSGTATDSSPEPSSGAPAPGPSSFVPGSVLTCPPGLADR